MNDCVSTLRLQDAWCECQRHAYHLRRAFHLPGAILPMTGNRFLSFPRSCVGTSCTLGAIVGAGAPGAAFLRWSVGAINSDEVRLYGTSDC